MSAPPEAPDDIKARIARMLDVVATERRPCAACGRTIWLVPTAKTGRPAPFTDNAVSHFADCPNADRFRKPKADR